MRRELEGNLLFDTGPLVEFIGGTQLGAYVKERLQKGDLRPTTGELNIAELRYLVCRKEGWRRSSEIIGALIDSAYLEVLAASTFLEAAARMKCQRAISITDCLTITMGESLAVPVVFARHEKEIDREISKEPFKSEIIFLTDLR